MLLTDLFNKEFCQFCYIKLKINPTWDKICYSCNKCNFNMNHAYIHELGYHIYYPCTYEKYNASWFNDFFTFSISYGKQKECQIFYKFTENKTQLYSGPINFTTIEELYKFSNQLLKEEIFK